MNPQNAKVKKTLLGKYEVTYACPGCGQNLKNSLDDAGIQDNCPHCEEVFTVPGLSFKQKMEKEAAEQAEAKRLAEEQKEAEKKAKEAADRHKKELAELAEEQERKKAERLKRAVDSESVKSDISEGSKEAINLISEGLMHLVKAFMLTIFMAILSSLIFLASIFFEVFDEGLFFVVLAGCGLGYLYLITLWLVEIGEAHSSFRYGAKAVKRKID